MEGWSLAKPEYINITTILRSDCTGVNPNQNETDDLNHPLVTDTETEFDYKIENYQCGYLFAGWDLSDTWTGFILLILSLALLWTCLVILVKILKSLLQEKIADMLKGTLNADLPGVPWLTGYIAMIFGAIITVLVQSSSVFTSTLTPLCGAGLLVLERVYPLTLGKLL